MSLMPAFIIEELGLQAHGYRVTPFGPYYQAFPDGRSITIYGDDPAKTHASVAQFSTKDAETLPDYEAWIHGVTEVVGPLLHEVPPNVGSMTLGDLLSQTKALWSMRRLGSRGVADATRLFTMSLSELLDRWFESDQMKTIMMVDGLIGQWSGPDEPGSAYVLLHHAIGSVGGASHTVNWGYPQGGMGSVADSIRAAAVSFGCEIRTDARVDRILVDDGRAVGVALATGEELRAPIVVSCIHPQIAFLRLLEREQLPAGFVFDIERWKTRSGVVKINVAMHGAPELHRRSRERAAGSSHRIGRTVPVARVRGASVPGRPPRASARGRAVRGWGDPDDDGPGAGARRDPYLLDVQPVGASRVERGPAPEELDAYADRAIDGYTELAPNFRDAVIDRQVIGPYDMEQELGLIGGTSSTAS
jgi:phytoene dehydrogenase-like protein